MFSLKGSIRLATRLLVLCAVTMLTTVSRTASAQPVDDKESKGARLKFQIYQDAAKEYRWRLKAGNGEILATGGQSYADKADAKNGVERIKSDVAGDKLKFETYEDKSMEHRWRLKATNGQVIATSSQGYKTAADCEHAIAMIKGGAADAIVDEGT